MDLQQAVAAWRAPGERAAKRPRVAPDARWRAVQGALQAAAEARERAQNDIVETQVQIFQHAAAEPANVPLPNFGVSCYFNTLVQVFATFPSTLCAFFARQQFKDTALHLLVNALCIACGFGDGSTDPKIVLKAAYSAVQKLLSADQQDATEAAKKYLQIAASVSESETPYSFKTQQPTLTCNRCRLQRASGTPTYADSIELQRNDATANVTLQQMVRFMCAYGNEYSTDNELTEEPCKQCNNKLFTKTNPIDVYPRLLNVNINQGKFNRTNELTFTSKFAIRFTDDDFVPMFGDFRYALKAVYVYGGDGELGHYTCYCKRGDRWYLFDDDNAPKPLEDPLATMVSLFEDKTSNHVQYPVGVVYERQPPS